jgi:hypothetical protein
VREGHEATNFAEFAKNYRHPSSRLVVRVPAHCGTVTFRTSGIVTGRRGIVESVGNDRYRIVGGGEFAIDATAEDAASLAVEAGGAGGILTLSDGEWVAPQVRAGGTTAPHLVGEPIVTLPTTLIGAALYELPAPALGRPVLEATSEPRIKSGESIAEARYEGIPEDRVEVVRRADGRWTTRHEVAARYLVIDGQGG